MNRDVELVFGKTGMGKTFWTRSRLRTMSRALIMDPQGEYRAAESFEDVGRIAERLQRERHVFRFSTSNVEEFDLLCDCAMAVGRVWLIVEEAQRVLPEGSGKPPRSFTDVIYRGRHPEVSLLVVSQRPTTVHISARSQWSRIVTFNQTERNDTAWIQSVSGFDVDPTTLRRGEYFDITSAGWRKGKLDLPAPGRISSEGRTYNGANTEKGELDEPHQNRSRDDGYRSADGIRDEPDQLHA